MPEPSAADLPVIIGRYRVLHKLGEGGMGIVYAAHDERLDRTVAIKMLRAHRGDERSGERFLLEARAAASVNHPNICQLYEIGEHDAQPFIAMELLDGEPLAARLSRGPLPVREAAQVGLDVLSALRALHQRGLVHRDLKPSNVFLTSHGVKLLDFGLARRLELAAEETQVGLTLPGTVVGTPQYMAPEQALGEAVDARADLFAVGVMLFEMLTGRPPFVADTPMKVLDAVLHEHVPALTGSPAIAAVDRVIHRTLAKKPADRYSSADAMTDDLRAAIWVDDSREVAPARAIVRLAVLPFRLLRGDAEIEFLAFSLADALTGSLSGLESLVVRSSLVAARFAGEALDLKRIGSELEVDLVLSGTLLRAGEQLRVGAQLVEVADGKMLWSQTSQVALGDLFELQDDLARRIVGALPLTARDRQARARADVPASARAYELYLRANQLSYEPSTWSLARSFYQECVKEDPNYAPAWARLGRLYRVLGKFGAEPAAVALPQAEAAFRRALDLNPDLALAHNLYAQLEVDFGRAEAALRRLLERATRWEADPELFAGLVHACRYCGLLEASLAAHERACRLDPSVRTSVVHTYAMMGDYARIVAVEDNPIGPVVGLALARLGREGDALQTLRLEEQRSVNELMRAFIGGARATLEGNGNEARRALQPIMTGEFPDGERLYYVATMLARLGLTDDALRQLAAAADKGFFCFPVYARDPWFDSIRSRPEFAAILETVEARHRAAVRLFAECRGDRLLAVRTAPR